MFKMSGAENLAASVVGKEAMSHTPEPWAIINSRITSGQRVVAETKEGANYENAQRIVACVNFCAGATNEELERWRSIFATGEILGAMADKINKKNQQWHPFDPNDNATWPNVGGQFLVMVRQHSSSFGGSYEYPFVTEFLPKDGHFNLGGRVTHWRSITPPEET